MKFSKLMLPVALAVGLSACMSNPTPPSQARSATVAPAATSQQNAAPAPAQMAQEMHFSCQNGSAVQVRYLNVNQVELRLEGKSATLNAAVSGSGERYVAQTGLFGRGAEWHQKGKMGMLSFVDPYGNTVETSCQAQ
ncbi:hypothetical protein EBQ24_07140 [Allofranklinella schreckenbergeri]|uniref:C-type lysozyme inhibitor domain-containing protein n=2 Tax=Allofranklinella schreckenbergeri TaxID=1076744 RepID=A0A3M6R2Z2_9BURK|nr:hypothetical protein EBQ24_07140 [Allofranklinella schreckenbergeri]